MHGMAGFAGGGLITLIGVSQGVENKKTFELNEEEINKLRDEVGKYTTEADLVSQGIGLV